MADLLDKAILIGMGLEKKAKEVLESLEQAGKPKEAAPVEPSAEGLPPKQSLENKVVEDGVRALKEFLALVKAGKDKIESEIGSSSGVILDKLHAATQDDVEVAKEMARIARERVEKLEKRVSDLEARLGVKAE